MSLIEAYKEEVGSQQTVTPDGLVIHHNNEPAANTQQYQPAIGEAVQKEDGEVEVRLH